MLPVFLHRFGVFLVLALIGCTDKPPEPPTLQTFVLRLESKYKRERDRNDIDLHFQSEGSNKIVLSLTFQDPQNRPLAESIADAAVELVKRNLKEDPYFKDRDIEIEKRVQPR